MPLPKRATNPPPEPPPQEAPPAKPSPTFVEDLFAPEFAITEMGSTSLINGMISLVMLSHRYDYSVEPAAVRKVVVCRLVMPPAAAQKMAVTLYAFLSKNGFGPGADDKKVQ